MIKVNRKGEIWVFAEQENGKLSEVPLELLGKARELADELELKNSDLNDAIGKIKAMSGLLPICSNCKKREWLKIEVFPHLNFEYSSNLNRI